MDNIFPTSLSTEKNMQEVLVDRFLYCFIALSKAWRYVIEVEVERGVKVNCRERGELYMYVGG